MARAIMGPTALITVSPTAAASPVRPAKPAPHALARSKHKLSHNPLGKYRSCLLPKFFHIFQMLRMNVKIIFWEAAAGSGLICMDA